jgi:hypothetical protein
MKVPKFLAVGLIAAGLAVGGSTAAHAATESPYVTVAWSFPAYPDVTAPQPYIGFVPGANLAAFDALAASPEWCGKPIQVDVYQRTDKHGVSWEVLKETGELLYGHDGGILAYNAGIGTPYRVITPEEHPCTTASPSSSPSPTTPATEPQPTSSPSTPSSSPSPTDSPAPPAPTLEPTVPTSPTPSPSEEPSPASPSPTKSPSSTPTTSPSPTATSSASSAPVAPSSSPAPPMARSASSTTPDELAYTGSDPWPGTAAALVLVISGLALLVVKHRRRASGSN